MGIQTGQSGKAQRPWKAATYLTPLTSYVPDNCDVGYDFAIRGPDCNF